MDTSSGPSPTTPTSCPPSPMPWASGYSTVHYSTAQVCLGTPPCPQTNKCDVLYCHSMRCPLVAPSCSLQSSYAPDRAAVRPQWGASMPPPHKTRHCGILSLYPVPYHSIWCPSCSLQSAYTPDRATYAPMPPSTVAKPWDYSSPAPFEAKYGSGYYSAPCRRMGRLHHPEHQQHRRKYVNSTACYFILYIDCILHIGVVHAQYRKRILRAPCQRMGRLYHPEHQQHRSEYVNSTAW